MGIKINEKESLKKDEKEIKKSNKISKLFFAKFNKSCLITYIGIIFGVLSMYFAFVKMALVESCFLRYSLACLIVAGVCDMFDGKFARACKRTEEEKAFGVQLDSLADTICFIATPVVIMFCMEMTRWFDVVIYIFFVICGISRLGYFNIQADLDEAVKTYKGLPVTSTAITYPLIGILHVCISTQALRGIYLILTLLTALLFVLNIRIPKLKGIAYYIVPILAAILITILLVI